jgi:hypothetical protein
MVNGFIGENRCEIQEVPGAPGHPDTPALSKDFRVIGR